jgi:hypothetical protein
MATSNFIAGKYTATFGATPGALGQSKDGIRLNHTIFKQLITGDNFAQAPQNAVYQGAECFVQWTLIEYNAAKVLALLFPYAATPGTYLDMGVIGRLDVLDVALTNNISQQLILTALAGTPAAASPATITLPLTVLAEGFPVEILMAPALREVPIRLRVYPNASGVFGAVT